MHVSDFVGLKEIHKQLLTLHIEMHQRNVSAKKLHAIFTHPIIKSNREVCNSGIGFRFLSALVVVHTRRLVCTDC